MRPEEITADELSVAAGIDRADAECVLDTAAARYSNASWYEVLAFADVSWSLRQRVFEGVGRGSDPAVPPDSASEGQLRGVPGVGQARAKEIGDAASRLGATATWFDVLGEADVPPLVARNVLLQLGAGIDAESSPRAVGRSDLMKVAGIGDVRAGHILKAIGDLPASATWRDVLDHIDIPERQKNELARRFSSTKLPDQEPQGAQRRKRAKDFSLPPAVGAGLLVALVVSGYFAVSWLWDFLFMGHFSGLAVIYLVVGVPLVLLIGFGLLATKKLIPGLLGLMLVMVPLADLIHVARARGIEKTVLAGNCLPEASNLPLRPIYPPAAALYDEMAPKLSECILKASAERGHANVQSTFAALAEAEFPVFVTLQGQVRESLKAARQAEQLRVTRGTALYDSASLASATVDSLEEDATVEILPGGVLIPVVTWSERLAFDTLGFVDSTALAWPRSKPQPKANSERPQPSRQERPAAASSVQGWVFCDNLYTGIDGASGQQVTVLRGDGLISLHSDRDWWDDAHLVRRVPSGTQAELLRRQRIEDVPGYAINRCLVRIR